MTHTIRAASTDHIVRLTKIIKDSFQTVADRFNLTPENCPTHPSNCTTEWVSAHMKKGVKYYILETENGPCGCMALEQAGPEVCYLERLAVLPGSRGNGFGKALLNHALAEAAKLDVKRVEIGIISKDVELRKWYENAGFCLTRVQQFDHLPFEVAFMRRNL
jgi:GNAT superfamily N-acetyltransferase